MINIKSSISVFMLCFIFPGCLVRYGEGRLDQLLFSVNELQKGCVANNEELTEEKIKESVIDALDKSGTDDIPVAQNRELKVLLSTLEAFNDTIEKSSANKLLKDI